MFLSTVQKRHPQADSMERVGETGAGRGIPHCPPGVWPTVKCLLPAPGSARRERFGWGERFFQGHFWGNCRGMIQEQVQAVVAATRPERLSDPEKPPILHDHIAHIVQLAGWGHATLAADHLLFPEIVGGHPMVVGGVIRQLSLRFVEARRHVDDGRATMERMIRGRQSASATLLQMAVNFPGPVGAYAAGVRAGVAANTCARLVRDGHCRFGNDYALGLRWLRLLGFEQVSTNPVLAALAYQDDPGLNQIFQAEVQTHRMFTAWARAPKKSADEIALYATLLALWDNLHVYRPIFFNLAGESGGGVVSFQLNPNIAHLIRESIQDASTAFAAAAEDRRVYDDYLLAGYPQVQERARPNMVIKVAASSPAAREIARTINRFGIG